MCCQWLVNITRWVASVRLNWVWWTCSGLVDTQQLANLTKHLGLEFPPLVSVELLKSPDQHKISYLDQVGPLCKIVHCYQDVAVTTTAKGPRHQLSRTPWGPLTDTRAMVHESVLKVLFEQCKNHIDVQTVPHLGGTLASRTEISNDVMSTLQSDLPPLLHGQAQRPFLSAPGESGVGVFHGLLQVISNGDTRDYSEL